MSWRSRATQAAQSALTQDHVRLKATLASSVIQTSGIHSQGLSATAGIAAAAVTLAARYIPEPWDPDDYAGFDTDKG